LRTDTQTESQTDAAKRFTPATVGVSKYNHLKTTLRDLPIQKYGPSGGFPADILDIPLQVI